MNFLRKQIDQGLSIVEKYQGNIPFHLYLKEIFRQNKNWGSKDRKNYRNICYTYFRHFQLLKTLNRDLKIDYLEKQLTLSVITDTQAFSFFEGQISDKLEITRLNQDFCKEPDVYFRALPKFEEYIEKSISEEGNKCEKIQTVRGIFKFSAKTNLDDYIQTGKGYIQDLSCQLAILKLSQHVEMKRVWDCCSGAGGKAIDMTLINPQIQLFCSDKRKQILINLRTRFQSMGLRIPNTQEIDLLTDLNQLNDGFFNQSLIVADVPCTGSGTWRRNPENLVHFKPELIQSYSSLQAQILKNIASFVKPEGYIFYMTCSIFKYENELNIEKFIKNHRYEVVFQDYFGGYQLESDTIFGCLLKKLP